MTYNTPGDYLLNLYNNFKRVLKLTSSSPVLGTPKRSWLLLRYKVNLTIRFNTGTANKSDVRNGIFRVVKSLLQDEANTKPKNVKSINQFKSIIRRMLGFPVIYNANGADESGYSKRALLIYLIKPFLYKPDDSELIKHQNNKRCRYISAILDEFGYIVDVADINDIYFKPTRYYDLVISVRNNLYEMESFFEKDVVKIYIATSLYHTVHNTNICRRHKLLYERRGCRVEPRRIYPEAMPYVKNSDAVIGVGNEFILRTWKEALNIPTYPFNNFGFRGTEFLIGSKNFPIARRNFLFFASKSQMQKGLDLLLEIFPKHPHLHLYVCSEYEKEEDFCACYYKELYKTSNIHPIGWVTVNSPKYDELVRNCAYVIHPSCSEGQPGSVVQCMYSALIPLVTKETGIDTEDFGVTFADDSLEEIERVIVEVSELPESWHRGQSRRTREVCEERYSEDAFMERWRNILCEILNRQDKKDDF